MKFITILITTIFIMCFASGHFWHGKTLSQFEVAKKWGKSKLDLGTFSKSDEKIRATMAYSILVNQKEFIGKSVTEIRNKFGQPDGFYFKDIFPAYLIQIAKSKNEEAWQIVFLLNQDRNVTGVIVHKNN